MLDNESLLGVCGGGQLTSSLINAIVKAVTTVFALGQIVGSSIRRAITNNVCKL